MKKNIKKAQLALILVMTVALSIFVTKDKAEIISAKTINNNVKLEHDSLDKYKMIERHYLDILKER